jgi:ketopantoate hydroxymethyltransferase
MPKRVPPLEKSYKLGDGLMLKKMIGMYLRLTPKHSKQYATLAKHRGASKSDFLRLLINEEWARTFGSRKDVPPTLVNAANAFDEVRDTLADAQVHIEWAVRILRGSKEVKEAVQNLNMETISTLIASRTKRTAKKGLGKGRGYANEL